MRQVRQVHQLQCDSIMTGTNELRALLRFQDMGHLNHLEDVKAEIRRERASQARGVVKE